MLLPDRSIPRPVSRAATMHAVTGASATPFRHRVARVAAAAVCGLAVCMAAQAGPQSQGDDAVSRLLQERGLSEPVATALPVDFTATTPATPKPGFAQKFRDSASGMVVSAMNFVGVRYVRGGTSAEEGFDCSGFTRHVFENTIGLVLPRRADEQAAAPNLVKVRRDDLQPGDLVFFNTLRRTFSHVGIYVGEDKFIHAPRTGGNVRVENMKVSYWSKRFTGGRRPAEGTVSTASVRTPAHAPQATPAPAPAAPSNTPNEPPWF